MKAKHAILTLAAVVVMGCSQKSESNADSSSLKPVAPQEAPGAPAITNAPGDNGSGSIPSPGTNAPTPKP
jgi:hypothetical protein